MFGSLLAPFYAARITIGSDGGMLLTSTRERMLAWGIVFCVIGAVSLTLYLVRVRRRLAMGVFLVSLLIPVLVMPAVKREYIHVLPHRIQVDSGRWYMPSAQVIELDDLAHITQDAPQFRLGGLLIEPDAVWHVAHRDGRRVRHELNGFFTAHRIVVAQYLRDRGMLVQRPPGCDGAC